MLISLADLKQIAKSSNQITALRQWVTVGGNLVVFDVGKKFANRDAVFKILGCKNPDPQFLEPKPGNQNLTQGQAPNIYSGPGAQFPRNMGALAPNSVVMKPVKKIEKQLFVSSSVLQGNVILIPDDMTKWKAKDWIQLQQMLSMSPAVISTVGSFAKNRNYLEGFSIPGIGKPPVLVFQILIGLFVLVIGPMSYYLCQSTGRPYMLLATTPLFALFAVLSLLGYGILSDGFGLRGRSQSVTRIDHSSRQAFTTSRQVFYSGISPGSCRFDQDSLVVDSRSEYSQPTQKVYRNAAQTISGGQIKARSPFQFTSLHCFETDQQLSLIGSADGTIATNGFETKVLVAIFKKDGKWYVARDIAPQEAAATEVVDFKQARETISKYVRREIVVDKADARLFRRRNYLPSGGSNQWGYVGSLAGKLRRPDSLREVFEVVDYVAIVEQESRMPEPLSNVEYDGNQLNIIVGNW